jgi:hypothetical protein
MAFFTLRNLVGFVVSETHLFRLIFSLLNQLFVFFAPWPPFTFPESS